MKKAILVICERQTLTGFAEDPVGAFSRASIKCLTSKG